MLCMLCFWVMKTYVMKVRLYCLLSTHNALQYDDKTLILQQKQKCYGTARKKAPRRTAVKLPIFPYFLPLLLQCC